MKLSQIAHARSGDKGNHANIGVIANDSAAFTFLGANLTAEVVSDFFSALKPSRVERFELPGIQAYNFLLHDVLEGGGSQSLRIDSQGKTLASILLELDLPEIVTQ